MKNSGKIDLPVIIPVIIVLTLCLVIFQGMQTNAQVPAKSGEAGIQYEPTPETFIELTAQLKQAVAEISELKARLQATESRGRILQNQYGELTRQLSLLSGRIQSSNALKADDRKKRLKIEKVARVSDGRPGPKDMVVSINKFSITWNQMDAVLNKLDEITQTLSRP